MGEAGGANMLCYVRNSSARLYDTRGMYAERNGLGKYVLTLNAPLTTHDFLHWGDDRVEIMRNLGLLGRTRHLDTDEVFYSYVEPEPQEQYLFQPFHKAVKKTVKEFYGFYVEDGMSFSDSCTTAVDSLHEDVPSALRCWENPAWAIPPSFGPIICRR